MLCDAVVVVVVVRDLAVAGGFAVGAEVKGKAGGRGGRLNWRLSEARGSEALTLL